MTMTRRAARLVYDSHRSSAAMGVRSAVVAGRSLVFRGGELTIDVVIHTSRGAWGCHYGQVIRHADGSSMIGIDVALDDGDPVKTDECGQFVVACDDARAARELRVGKDGDVLTLALPVCSN